MPDPREVRAAAWKKVGGGFAGMLLGSLIVLWLQKGGRTLYITAYLMPAVPAAYGLAGLIELVTGRSFSELSNAWNDLKGWQRGVLGTVIVLLAMAVAFLLMGLVVSRLMK